MGYHATHSYDTLAYTKRLEKAGIERKQAEAHAEVLRDIIDENLATKTDILRLEERIKKDILRLEERTLRLEEKIKIDILRLEEKIKIMEYKITLRLGSITAGGIAFLAALVVFLKFI